MSAEVDRNRMGVNVTSATPGVTSGRERHLVVVDDEEGVRRALHEYFKVNGYRVTTVASAAEAMVVLDRAYVDLIVIDLVMPEVDGMELLQRLHQERPNLPVIIMTGMGFDESALREARENGASGFISKGLPISQLLFEVHRLLNYP